MEAITMITRLTRYILAMSIAVLVGGAALGPDQAVDKEKAQVSNLRRYFPRPSPRAGATFFNRSPIPPYAGT